MKSVKVYTAIFALACLMGLGLVMTNPIEVAAGLPPPANCTCGVNPAEWVCPAPPEANCDPGECAMVLVTRDYSLCSDICDIDYLACGFDPR